MSTAALRNIVILGTGELAQVVHACLEGEASRVVVAFAVERRFVKQGRCCGLPVVPFEDIDSHYPAADHAVLPALGPMDRNRVRARFFDGASAKGYEIDRYVDPSVRFFPSTRTGRGTSVFDGVSLQPFAEIGDDVVVRPLVYVGHHATIESHTFIAPHVTILSGARIGAFGFIGAGSLIARKVTIGPHSIIGAGATVTEDVPARSVVRGPSSGGPTRARGRGVGDVT